VAFVQRVLQEVEQTRRAGQAESALQAVRVQRGEKAALAATEQVQATARVVAAMALGPE